MKLNFFPYYEPYLRQKVKTTTFRVSNQQPFQKDDDVELTIGWEEGTAISIGMARIRQVYSRRIKELQDYDFEGESPDCKTQETTKLVLGAIYRKVLKEEDSIWILKFDHLENIEGKLK